MYLHEQTIAQALLRLSESTHTFYGVTYLACKANGLPVGKDVDFPIDKYETEFLEKYYRPDPDTDRYYRVFRTSDKQNHWLRPDFPSKGSQRTRTSKFKDAFLHPKGTQRWGWTEKYVDVLQQNLYSGKRIPTLALAVWLFRDRTWKADTTAQEIVTFFYHEFDIQQREQELLFDDTSSEKNLDRLRFQTEPAQWEEIRFLVNAPLPPNAPDDTSGTLAYMGLTNVGPAQHLEIDFADRVNIFTGDNGLGKTFILECAWWALTGTWTADPIWPQFEGQIDRDFPDKPQISFTIAGELGRRERLSAWYDWNRQDWIFGSKRQTLPGLLLYARVDGAFAVWDSARRMSAGESQSQVKPLVFDRNEVWNGIATEYGGKPRFLANGLIADWIVWQSDPNQEKFDTLKKVLRRLSPTQELSEGDLGILEPGRPVRTPSDSRLMPTITHSYGEVPLIYASAAVRRIVSLAYLLVWTWEEHKAHIRTSRMTPQTQMVILVDEIEAHLHPRWQRVILPALLDVAEDLGTHEADVDVQFILSTHSPLVMASVEPHFDREQDKVFHLDLRRMDLYRGDVILKEVPFEIRGTVDSWLMTDNVFEMRQPRSAEGEKAVIDAIHLQQQRENPTHDEVAEVHVRLKLYLGTHDLFWPRWIRFATLHGVIE